MEINYTKVCNLKSIEIDHDPKLFQPWSLKIDQPLDHGMLLPRAPSQSGS